MEVVLTDLLEDWGVLNKNLLTLDEAACKALLKREQKGKNRLSFVIRIHGRYNVLRNERERWELTMSASPHKDAK